MNEVIEWAKVAGLNTLFVQVRSDGDAYYNSRLVPRSENLKNQPVSFDPLAYLLKKIEGLNIDVHAYINLGIVWRKKTPPVDPLHIFRSHPEWVLRDEQGKMAFADPFDTEPKSLESYYWLNWGHEQAREHLAEVALEILRNYKVKGIHFDYVRYPSRMGPNIPAIGFNQEILEPFKKEFGKMPIEYTKEWDQWRARQINTSLKYIRNRIKAQFPQASVSAAVLAAWDLAFGRIFTDYRKAVEEDIYDFVVLMSYFKTYEESKRSIFNAKEVMQGNMVVAGFLIKDGNVDDIARRIDLARDEAIRGFSLFSLDRETVKIPESYLAKLRELAIPDIADQRYSSRDEIWSRLAILSENQKSAKSRFFSRNGKNKLVIYGQNVEKIQFSINEKSLPGISLKGKPAVVIDISSYTNPNLRNEYDNHDFYLDSKIDCSSYCRAELFQVDYYQ